MLKTCVKKQGCYGSKDPEADHGNGLENKGYRSLFDNHSQTCRYLVGYFIKADSTASYTLQFCIFAVSMIVRASQICCPPVSLRSTTACFCFRLNLRS